MALNRTGLIDSTDQVRLVHWGVFAALIGVLWLVFLQHARMVQAQAELAAVKSTLGALRTALIIDFLDQKASRRPVAFTKRNPFELLDRYPPNYRGEFSTADVVRAPEGSWVFDPVCTCVGYLPLDAQWFNSPSGDVMAWFEVKSLVDIPRQLVSREMYLWQGQRID